jgi:hypothetical protein
LFTYFEYRDLPPSQGGKYVGFGSSPAPKAKNDDFFDSTLSSLSSVRKKYYLI